MKNIACALLLMISTFSYGQKTIADARLETLQGKSVQLLDEVSEDRITVLTFWATWCVPCINELDAISDVYEDWQDETNVEIIAIATDDTRTQKRIKPLVNGKGWEYKVLLDKNQALKRTLNISIIPHIIVLKGNKILYRHTGYTPGSEDELYEIIQKYAN